MLELRIGAPTGQAVLFVGEEHCADAAGCLNRCATQRHTGTAVEAMRLLATMPPAGNVILRREVG